jgi:uncharacterized membrane protein YedE/YeeE
MITRDYTQEVGVRSGQKNLPRPVAFVLLAIIAAGIIYGIVGVVRQTRIAHAAEKAQSAPAATVGTPVPAPKANAEPAASATP